ncbi:MAG: hypothetical protein GF308_18130 [Candidatus Heimdallarchaeota archaeon]|nr:hypothetical protein [Candidatus Heimdallarchaeota archaeon]
MLAGIVFRKNWSAEFSAIFRHIPGLGFIPEEIPLEAIDWVTLIHDLPFIGLVYLNFFDVINYLLVGLLFGALVLKMKKEYKYYALAALIVGLVGIILYWVMNNTFVMFRLTKDYYAATSDPAREDILAQVEQVLTRYNPGAYYPTVPIIVSRVCFALAGLTFSILVLKQKLVRVWLGIMGIIAHGFLLLYFPLLLIIPLFAYIAIPAAAPFLMIWHIGTGYRLVKPRKETVQETGGETEGEAEEAESEEAKMEMEETKSEGVEAVRKEAEEATAEENEETDEAGKIAEEKEGEEKI